MRNDGPDRSRVAACVTMPAIDHEANGPLSAIVQLTAWLGRVWSRGAEGARGPSMLQRRR